MRALRIGLILLVILGGLAVAADRLAVRFAEGEVASKAHSGLDLHAEPGVSIKGFPFLTQVVGKELERVDLDLNGFEVEIDGEQATLDGLDVELYDVRLENNYSDAVATRATGSGLMSYAELSALAGTEGGFGLQFGPGEGNQVEIRITVLDRAVGPALTSDIAVDGNIVQMQVGDIPSLEELPVLGSIPGIESTLRERIDRERELAGLPSGLALSEARATDDGLELTVEGTDVRLTGNLG
ncbi:DUF2993 domain-containing protein [Streptomyces sp. ACA25]|uniref:LmeA family phospholipid-binding protein n=1 Tax=Streptomyces sp. ACA25 TaxID=3022596 RepID=UPI0023070C8B|nr:DUF2993 domain-containing protein [Streptomyces sp. ACA25]MDB1087966.1 DUF2993 domain-containing protein [Streptomyces sp. ACA25]